MEARSMQCESEAEQLFVEQAVAMYRELRELARQAPDGEVINQTELVAVARGRELTRQALESITQAEVGELEKKLRRAANASAEGDANIAVVDRVISLPQPDRSH